MVVNYFVQLQFDNTELGHILSSYARSVLQIVSPIVFQSFVPINPQWISQCQAFSIRKDERVSWRENMGGVWIRSSSFPLLSLSPFFLSPALHFPSNWLPAQASNIFLILPQARKGKSREWRGSYQSVTLHFPGSWLPAQASNIFLILPQARKGKSRIREWRGSYLLLCQFYL